MPRTFFFSLLPYLLLLFQGRFHGGPGLASKQQPPNQPCQCVTAAGAVNSMGGATRWANSRWPRRTTLSEQQ